ncbi:hypothetical protein [Clostridium scatologenes]|uniref:Uncharacterized protein n=1 Tax=Clostridium scatologenes TaxID=1548 RepID=A0A0E3K3V1_CLOSL|nr:hypothetical protein [Clostridium scatologenes]AKA71945.1 hypothetical protein CSCA_4820 [Clostridium scatologenes]
MAVKFDFPNGVNELDLKLFNDILLKLKIEIKNDSNMEFYGMTFDTTYLLKDYSKEEIYKSMHNIFDISLLKLNHNSEYKERMILDYKKSDNEIIIGFYNVLYLKKNFYL